ncbi:MAG: 16S rRNA (guanine(527)-N(7))-methyltransferase RsmG [Dehalococcoidia bacterium]
MELLAEGARSLGLALSPAQLEQFEAYYRALAVAKVDLTAVTDYQGVQRRYFLESLALLTALYDAGALGKGRGQRLMDLGAGAGLPGLPVKIADPSLRLVLLEATGKKAEFLRQVVEELGLMDVAVVSARAEVAAHEPDHRQAYDVVAARAVAGLPVLVELALPFLRLGGHLAAPKGSRASQEVQAAARALQACGGQVVTVRRLTVPAAVIPPTLVLVRKVAPTPPQYPRRPGIPAKRPLR